MLEYQALFGRKELQDAVGLAAPIASGKIKAVLGNLLFRKAEDLIAVEGTNLECSVVAKVTAQTADWKDTLLPADALGKICREAGGDDVVIKVDESTGVALVVSDFSEWELPTADPKEFPTVSDAPKGGVACKSEDLLAAINVAKGSVSNIETKWASNCIRFELNGKTLTLVATDTRTLGTRDVKVSGDDVKAEASLPGAYVNNFAAALAGGEAKLVLGKNDIYLTCGGTTFYSRQLDGRYPPWQGFIPKKHVCKWTCKAGELGKAIRRCYAATDSFGYLITLTPGGEFLDLRFASGGRTGKDRLKVAFEGEAITLKTQVAYLLTALRAFDPEEEVSMLGLNDRRPFRLVNADGLSVVMVMPCSEGEEKGEEK